MAAITSVDSRTGSGAQALDRPGERELGSAHALDEVPPPAHAERLEVVEGVIQRGKATANVLRQDLLARDDSVALEQQFGQRAAAIGGAGRILLARAEDPGRERPAALDLRLGPAALAAAETRAGRERAAPGARAGLARATREALRGAAGAAPWPPRASVSRGARSGAHASLVTSPAHTRSQSASRRASAGASQATSRSEKKHGPLLQAAADQLVLGARRAAARGAPLGGGPIVGASSRKYSATRPERPSGPAPDPRQLAAGAQLVQPRGRVGARAARDHVALPALERQRQSLQRHQHLAQAVDPGARPRAPVDALPGRQEGRQPALLGGLDLLAQGRQRGPAQAPQDLHVAPLALAAAGAQLAAHERSRALELAQHRAAVDAVALVQLRGREGAVGAGEARHQLREGVLHGRQERLRQPARGRRPERVAVQARLVGGDVALAAGQPQADRAALAHQLAQQGGGVDPLEDAFAGLELVELADLAQHVVQLVAAGRAGHLRAPLQVVLHPRQRARVDQLAQLLLAQQLAQQVAVQRQHGRPALGRGRVPLVHVGGHVVEQQRGGERRGGARLDLHQRDLA